MTTHYKSRRLNWKKYLATLLMTCAAIHLHAQFFPGGGGNPGGGGQTSGRSGSRSSQRTYTAPGDVGDIYFSIDQDSHKVVIVADADTMKAVSQVISNLDRPQPQVLIKVVFVEVTYNNALDLGLEGAWGKNVGDNTSTAGASGFGLSSISSALSSTNLNSAGLPTSYFSSVAGSPVTSSGAGLYQVMGANYQVTLRAIAQAGRAKILSRPSVLARNNQPATVTVGSEYPQITGTTYSTQGNAVNSVGYTDVGVILKVTPYITSEGMVQMILQPQISAVDPTTAVTISAGVTANAITIRSADTVVVTPDGQTVVIGGLIQDSKTRTDTKIPLLGDIPYLGNLFKHQQTSDAKTELIMFLTPHVVAAPSLLAARSDEEQRRSEIRKAVTEDQMNRFLDTLPVKELPPKDQPKDKKKKKSPKSDGW
jgi:general secretion pathway protein D